MRLSSHHLAAAFAATSLLASAPAVAKEVTSGGTPTPTTCQPVSGITTRGDARVGETGLASIDVTYSVKPCDKNPVTVGVTMAEAANPAAVAYDNPASPLSGKFTVFGVRVRVSYVVTVTVRDAATGAVVGSQFAYAGAVPKGV